MATFSIQLAIAKLYFQSVFVYSVGRSVGLSILNRRVKKCEKISQAEEKP